MRKRRIPRKFGSPPTQIILLLTVIIFAISILVSIMVIDKGIKPTLMEIATEKTNEFATRAINRAVSFTEDYDFSDIANITYDNNGNVAAYSPDAAAIGEINRNATNRVEEYFHRLNRGDPIFHEDEEPFEFEEGATDRILDDPTLVEIPLGQVTGNTVLANLGPRIPINLEVIGTVRTDITREQTEFGINGVWISFYLTVEADVQVIIPFTSDVTTVTAEIYIDGGAILGDVPDFYGGNSGPSIAVPRDEIGRDLQNAE
ncbi:sporulation protein YunB [Oceanobacillus alkalisoli]|uniref:sporulation protein YunB n=1 Tax=Oceanobacillus alkalisoli TaxID=2925113 RepID=UPI001F11B21F|nr:sporulation protein YunB [Oceanobacillus alkalisoli]MCF3943251.1 sporulation protein YunB [Oceanobacillus alkalisoli]